MRLSSVLVSIPLLAVACGGLYTGGASSGGTSSGGTSSGGTSSGGTSSGGTSSGGTSSGGGAAGIPKDQFATTFENAVCGNIESCCKSAGFAYDQAGCRAWLQSTYGWRLSSAGTYDANAAAECVQSTTEAMKICGSLGLLVPPCSNVFTGAKATGEPCSSDLDCAAVSGADVSCNSGACVAKPRGKQGDGCNVTCTERNTGVSCTGFVSGGGTATCYTNEGLYCSDNGLCAPLGRIGQPCGSHGCVDAAYCNGGTCAEKQPAGSQCQSSSSCTKGTYCALDASTGTCTDQKGNGVACGSNDECVSGWCRNGACRSIDISPSLCSNPQPDGGGGFSGGSGG